MIEILAQGVLLGLSAGFAPGPILTLVISESLRHGSRAGIRVALAPLVTDLPIIAFTMFFLSRTAHLRPLLGVISILGGVFVFYLGWESLTSRGLERDPGEPVGRSLQKGVLTNMLSPHPYLFWLTVGGPITWKALDRSPAEAALFVGGFYLFLVGTKLTLAVAAGRNREFLKGRTYVMVLRGLGVLLCLLVLLLLRDGARFLAAAG